jgi:hypothetical protein
LLVAVLIPATASRRRGSKQATRQQKKDPVLSSENRRDVRELQKRLHTASLEFAKNLLKLFEAVRESRHGSEDPEEIEKRRIELETIEKGDYREGTGWTWNGHLVPSPESSSPFFERRKRIISNGTWNPARKGWEFQGEFFGVWDH